MAESIWLYYDELRRMPLQAGLPRPEENHHRIRSLLRQAINHDGLEQASRSLFKPHYGMQMVLMLAESQDKAYERIYFLAYYEGYPIEVIRYKGRYREEGEGDG